MVLNYSQVSDSVRVDLFGELDRLASLRDVLSWAAMKPKSDFHPQIIAEVITQDEFTHDVIVPYRDLFLTFDTT